MLRYIKTGPPIIHAAQLVQQSVFHSISSSHSIQPITMSFKKLTIDQLDLNGKRVLIRPNLAVPMKDGEIQNPYRIEESLKTIQYALDNGARAVIIISHLLRPRGQRVEKLSMKPIARVLQEKLNREVIFLPDSVGDEVEKICCNPPYPGCVIMLENLRFHVEEQGKGVDQNGEKIVADKENVKKFRQFLSRLGDVYVNDAFGHSHQVDSSLVGIHLEQRAAGLTIQKELMYFSKLMDNPNRPFLAILGGAKAADKIPMISNLLTKVDEMIIGGGMAFTFLKILNNMKIGKSLFDEDGAKMVREIMQKAASRNVQVHFPIDFIPASKYAENAEIGDVVSVEEGIPDDWMGLDIGPRSADKFVQIIGKAKTIVWNGPMGVFEWDNFDRGTKRIMDAMVEATERGVLTVIGGGDTGTACAKFGTEKKVSHLSTGGAATLALLGGQDMPAITSLSPAPSEAM